MMSSFCSGVARANTRARARRGSSRVERSRQSTTRPSAAMMPSSAAIARAVAGWSPVISTGVMPAAWQARDGGGGRAAGAGRGSRPGRAAPVPAPASGRGGGGVAVGLRRRRGPGSPSRASSSARAVGARRAVAASVVRTRAAAALPGRPCRRSGPGRPGRWWAVVIRLRSLSNGQLARRAATAAASVGLVEAELAGRRPAARPRSGRPRAVHGPVGVLGRRAAPRRCTAPRR